ncbi:MAG TPA: NAD(P)-dependent oxidoreductase [Burkholderiales bacterium]|nr:NAD(P)-dependent oxidoreductase [Burkholderiales bacterium]
MAPPSSPSPKPAQPGQRPLQRPRVLLTDPIAGEGLRVLEAAAEVVQAPDGEPDTVRRLAREADGIIIRSKLPDDIFDDAPRLRAIVIHGTGTDLVRLDEASRRGIAVANLPGANAPSVAEYCAMAMLTLARNTPAITSAMRTAPWDSARALGSRAHEIGGMTLGIVGVGAIGRHLARIARQGFGMRVLGHQRRLDRMGPDAEPASLETLLGAADFVVLACPLTAQTRHLMNRRTFALMKPSAWLVNVGRGAVVEEEALLETLRERKIAGAMLDVYEHYRIAPGHPLFALDNVVLTPHLAGMTVESRARMASAAAEELLRMLRGERPRNPVNPVDSAPQAPDPDARPANR